MASSLSGHLLSCNKYLLNTYYVPSTVLGSKDILENQVDKQIITKPLLSRSLYSIIAMIPLLSQSCGHSSQTYPHLFFFPTLSDSMSSFSISSICCALNSFSKFPKALFEFLFYDIYPNLPYYRYFHVYSALGKYKLT